MINDRPTVTKKSFYVNDYAIRWPIGGKKLIKREDRTLLREKFYPFRDYSELREITLTHDTKVLARWLQRGLIRKKAILINEPEIFTSSDFINDGLEIKILQRAIPYDPVVYEYYKDYKALMLPPGQYVLELAVLNG
jgi:hypothetical protein